MEIILKKDIARLGAKNDVVNVKPGYARNFLIPQGYAITATLSAKKVAEENFKQQTHKAEKMLETAKEYAEKLKDISIKIGAKVGQKGKIFGSINTIQLSDALKAEGFDVLRSNITIKEPHIKEIGKYNANIQLHKEVNVDVEFEVVEE